MASGSSAVAKTRQAATRRAARGDVSPTTKPKNSHLAKPWKPGQSGNPSGLSKEKLEVRELARTYTPEAIATLASVMRGEEREKKIYRAGKWVTVPVFVENVDRVRAAEALLDRGWGRPGQSVNVTNDDGSLAGLWAQALVVASLPPTAKRTPPLLPAGGSDGETGPT